MRTILKVPAQVEFEKKNGNGYHRGGIVSPQDGTPVSCHVDAKQFSDRHGNQVAFDDRVRTHWWNRARQEIERMFGSSRD